jgi:hypothetical protein
VIIVSLLGLQCQHRLFHSVSDEDGI